MWKKICCWWRGENVEEVCRWAKLMPSKPNRSTSDYLFEKADRYFRRARANPNARFELEALGNAFVVKAIELETELSIPRATSPICPDGRVHYR